MTLSYFPRLLCLCLEAFFLLYLVLGALVSLLAQPSIRLSDRIRAASAARMLLALRLLPALGATCIVLLVCLPSYLWLEPDDPSERVSMVCLLLAGLGILTWCLSAARGFHAALRSSRFLRDCRAAGSPLRLPGATEDDVATAWLVDAPPPLLALGGIVRPQLVISRAVLQSLPSGQMDAALRHERAHWTAHDNLKRLSILSTPAILPFGSINRILECSWRKQSEWAADDRAVAGDPQRSIALASALVAIARMHAPAPAAPVLSCLLGETDQLSARVNRLLNPAPPAGRAPLPHSRLAWAALWAIGSTAAVALLQPAALHSIHTALEHLM